MVPSKLPFQVHKGLIETFYWKIFIFCVDLYQLLLVTAKPVFMFDEYSPLLERVASVDLWCNIKIAELNEVILQKNDADFIHLLNKVRVENLDNNVENIRQACFVSKNNPSYLIGDPHNFAEIRPEKVHTQKLLNNLSSPLYFIYAEDQIPKSCSNADIVEAINCSHSEICGLALLLRLKTNARVMITTNIDIPSKLMNGELSIIK